ncbi:DUF1016 family protein [Myxococcota bacterium]|nr:DUF1016 family protein [Myxococcota bacterium]MBU1410593.1 DUF1016 family protein [Myxococcota bacterium]MBU1511353.1 DUF1016 family protein [Myxococcota bacterium]
MTETFNFLRLVDLCQETHAEMQKGAARVAGNLLAVRNWLIGSYIVEFEQNGSDYARYGSSTLLKLSAALAEVSSRGFSVDSLELMRRFYLVYRGILSAPDNSETVSRNLPLLNSETVSRKSLVSMGSGERIGLQSMLTSLIQTLKLTWSHYVTLMTITSPEERRFYEIEAATNDWSVREMERQLASSLYERLALSKEKDEIRRLSREGQVVEKAADLVKNPLVLEFLGLSQMPSLAESELESAIIDHLEHFLLELGKGFLFEARQKRFTFDNDHFYVDLVFYNRLLRCYVLIDLKRDKLTHQDLGQMQMYVNYFDRNVKLKDELPTVGIVLCHRKNDALVELTLPKDTNIFASRYQLYLPSKLELKAQLELVESRLNPGGA